MTIWIETDLPDAEDFSETFLPHESPDPEVFIPHESPEPYISSNTKPKYDTDEILGTIDVLYDDADDYVYDYSNIFNRNTKYQFHPKKFLADLYESYAKMSKN
tara:strand:+ start:396 stop:704 length:309 start_codon:yes stop_codon:yes gene_type:complete